MSQATREAQGAGKRSLLEVALDVHTDITGSGERPDGEHRRDVSLLRLAIETWEPSSITKFKPFDDAVKDLIERALAEAGWR